jgi:hypothetical protein
MAQDVDLKVTHKREELRWLLGYPTTASGSEELEALSNEPSRPKAVLGSRNPPFYRKMDNSLDMRLLSISRTMCMIAAVRPSKFFKTGD